MPLSFAFPALVVSAIGVWLARRYAHFAASEETVLRVPPSGILRFLLWLIIVFCGLAAILLPIAGLIGIDLLGAGPGEHVGMGLMCLALIAYPWLVLHYCVLESTQRYLFFAGVRYEWSEVDSVQRTLLGTKFRIPGRWSVALNGELWLPGDPWPLSVDDVARLEAIRRRRARQSEAEASDPEPAA